MKDDTPDYSRYTLADLHDMARRMEKTLFGEDEINIHSKPEKMGTVYFAVVPEQLVQDLMRWVRVDVSGNRLENG